MPRVWREPPSWRLQALLASSHGGGGASAVAVQPARVFILAANSVAAAAVSLAGRELGPAASGGMGVQHVLAALAASEACVRLAGRLLQLRGQLAALPGAEAAGMDSVLGRAAGAARHTSDALISSCAAVLTRTHGDPARDETAIAAAASCLGASAANLGQALAAPGACGGWCDAVLQGIDSLMLSAAILVVEGCCRWPSGAAITSEDAQVPSAVLGDRCVRMSKPVRGFFRRFPDCRTGAIPATVVPAWVPALMPVLLPPCSNHSSCGRGAPARQLNSQPPPLCRCCRHLEGVLLQLFASMAAMSAAQGPDSLTARASIHGWEVLEYVCSGHAAAVQVVLLAWIDALPRLAPLYPELGCACPLVKCFRGVLEVGLFVVRAGLSVFSQTWWVRMAAPNTCALWQSGWPPKGKARAGSAVHGIN